MVTLVKKFMYSFDDSINFPIGTVSPLRCLESAHTPVSHPHRTCSAPKAGHEHGEGLEAFVSHEKACCRSSQWPLWRPYRRDSCPGLEQGTTSSSLLPVVRAVAKAVISNLFNRGDPSVRMASCAQDNPGLRLRSQCCN